MPPRAEYRTVPDSLKWDIPGERVGPDHVTPVTIDSSVHSPDVAALFDLGDRQLQKLIKAETVRCQDKASVAIGAGAVWCTFLERPPYTGEL